MKVVCSKSQLGQGEPAPRGWGYLSLPTYCSTVIKKENVCVWASKGCVSAAVVLSVRSAHIHELTAERRREISIQYDPQCHVNELVPNLLQIPSKPGPHLLRPASRSPDLSEGLFCVHGSLPLTFCIKHGHFMFPFDSFCCC